MKKSIITTMIAVMLVLCMAIPVLAAGSYSVTADVSTVGRGDTVTVTVEVPEVSNVQTGAIEIVYDTAAFTIESGAWSTPSGFIDSFDPANGTGVLMSMSLSTVPAGTIFTFTLKVNDDAVFADYDISVNVKLVDGDSVSRFDETDSITVTVACPNHKLENIVDEKFLVSPADCENAATYYVSCASCGEKGDTTFADGNPAGHSGGTATCTEQAICEVCSNPYGELAPHDFVDDDTLAYPASEATCMTPAQYYKVCSVCKNPSDTETFGYGDTAGHIYATEYSHDGAQHWYACTTEGCDSKSEAADHTGGEATCTAKAVCDVCSASFGKKLDHTYGEWVYFDEYDHERQCEVCKSYNYESHFLDDGVVKTPATEEAPGVMVYTCYECWEEMEVEIPQLGHTHEHTADWKNDDNNHWNECACGDKTNVAAHTYTESVTKKATCTAEGETTKVCSVCGHTVTAPIAATGHSFDGGKVTTEATCKAEGVKTYTCSGCGETKTESIAKTDHKWNDGEITTPATTEAEGVKTYTCSVCGETKTESVAKLEHTHAYGDEWKSDADSHWHECECGEVADKAAHAWNDGVVTTEATEEATGVKTYTCADCGAEKTETIPALEPVSDPEPDNSSVIIIVVVVVVVCVVAGAVVFFVLKKKA